MNTENEFQLTLPSNASITFSPDNKPTNYITTLPSHISLEGEWEVALIDILYPHNWMNITKDIYLILLIETSNKDKGFRTTLSSVLFNSKSKYKEESGTELRRQLWVRRRLKIKMYYFSTLAYPKDIMPTLENLLSHLMKKSKIH